MQMAFTGTVVAPAATLNFQGSGITYSGAYFGLGITGGPNLTYARNPFPSWTETPSNPMVVGPARLVTAASGSHVTKSASADHHRGKSPSAEPAPHHAGKSASAETAPRRAAKGSHDPQDGASRSRSKKKKKS